MMMDLLMFNVNANFARDKPFGSWNYSFESTWALIYIQVWLQSEYIDLKLFINLQYIIYRSKAAQSRMRQRKIGNKMFVRSLICGNWVRCVENDIYWERQLRNL